MLDNLKKGESTNSTSELSCENHSENSGVDHLTSSSNKEESTSNETSPPATGSMKKVTPLPLPKIALLGCILAANNSSVWMIFSFLPFMVAMFFPELSTKELGFKAGILGLFFCSPLSYFFTYFYYLGSAFSCGSLIGNMMWGILADKFGRRPVLLSGLVGTTFAALGFGFSPTFWSAVFFRFMWGLLNGNIGVSKTYMGEILDESNTAGGMALYGVIGGVGRTIGPIIGGYLSMPADQYPIFRHTVFEKYPFSLPSLIIAINCVIIFVVALFYLPETPYMIGVMNRNSSGNIRTYERLDNDERTDELSNAVSPLNTPSEIELLESGSKIEKPRVSFCDMVQVKDIESEKICYRKLNNVTEQDSPIGKRSVISKTSFEREHDEEETSNVIEFDRYGKRKNSDDYSIVPLNEDHDDSNGTVGVESQVFTNGSELVDFDQYKKQSIFVVLWKLISRREIFISTLLYGLIGFVQLSMNEVFPLWVVTSKSDGGFGFDSHSIGLISMISGPIGIAAQLLIYPSVVAKYGVLATFLISMFFYALILMIMPLTSTLNHLNSTVVVWSAIVAVLSMMTIAIMWSMITVFVLINNSCYSHERAKVNGIGQSMASLGRLFGPYTGASLFAWSEVNGLGWPLNYYFAFYFLSFISIGIFFTAKLLPNSIQRRKREPKVPRYSSVSSL